jgi:hypothetical protein
MKYPNLTALLAGSFYECWADFDDRAPDEIVKDSLGEASLTELQGAIEELDNVFELIKKQTELVKLIGSEIGCNYDPEYDGLSCVEWLVDLKKKIIQHEKAKN